MMCEKVQTVSLWGANRNVESVQEAAVTTVAAATATFLQVSSVRPALLWQRGGS